MIQLILHLIGDYLTQSNWMAQQKTKSHVAAACHAIVYSLPFLLIASVPAFLVILVTHFFIDRYRLVRYVVYAKNFLSPPMTCEVRIAPSGHGTAKAHAWTKWWHDWEDCSSTGYHNNMPAWLSVWLMIAADNTLHLLINYLSIEFL